MTNGKTAIFKPDGVNAIHDGIEHAPGGGKALLDPTDTALLLLDHPSGLFQTSKTSPWPSCAPMSLQFRTARTDRESHSRQLIRRYGRYHRLIVSCLREWESF